MAKTPNTTKDLIRSILDAKTLDGAKALARNYADNFYLDLDHRDEEEINDDPIFNYVVVCRVSGGVTGTREGLLKENGEIKYFESFEAAKAEAARLMTIPRSSTYGATYSYWAEER